MAAGLGALRLAGYCHQRKHHHANDNDHFPFHSYSPLNIDQTG
jgi:hypothetical protein